MDNFVEDISSSDKNYWTPVYAGFSYSVNYVAKPRGRHSHIYVLVLLYHLVFAFFAFAPFFSPLSFWILENGDIVSVSFLVVLMYGSSAHGYRLGSSCGNCFTSHSGNFNIVNFLKIFRFPMSVVDVLVKLIDHEDYQCGIEEIIDSMQYKKLNK